MDYFIPDNLHTITPYLIVEEGEKAIAYYRGSFGAEVLEKHLREDGKVLHARIRIGNSQFMLSDEMEGSDLSKPKKGMGSCSLLHLYVKDVDTDFQRAVENGGTVIIPLANMFWGDRYAQIEDPFGHRWALSTPILEN